MAFARVSLDLRAVNIFDGDLKIINKVNTWKTRNLVVENFETEELLHNLVSGNFNRSIKKRIFQMLKRHSNQV